VLAIASNSIYLGACNRHTKTDLYTPGRWFILASIVLCTDSEMMVATVSESWTINLTTTAALHGAWGYHEKPDKRRKKISVINELMVPWEVLAKLTLVKRPVQPS
jgi:hypothetical protein